MDLQVLKRLLKDEVISRARITSEVDKSSLALQIVVVPLILKCIA